MTLSYRRHADLRLTALEGEGVVLHLGSRRYFTVSETGYSILQALDQPRTEAELLEVIANEYETSPAEASTSVRAFLTQCVESSLVLEVPR